MTMKLIIATALVCGCASAVDIEQWKPHDFTFRAASGAGNPFDTELTGIFTGPDNLTLKIPGFYDGDGVWKIRFSAPLPGDWRMQTASPVAALNGKTETIRAAANKNTRIHGVLQVDRERPYHFRVEDGARFYLLGYEADWLWGADMLDPKRKVMNRLIDQMDTYGFNYVLVDIYAHDTRWCPGKVNEWDYGPTPLYVFGGTNEKPDHSVLNTKFFAIYDGMMEALWRKGII
ncbi:MAG TPA: DUF5060 domain-containing protein, partial [Bryobacteraceae bacterium]|nr:DUF5060 domain-containing protein [Bryobacteraceae bacterium]